VELAKLAKDAGIEIIVCHFAPGTSKWNKVEHRLFSFISMNWRGKRLTSHEVIVELIGAMTTTKGLAVHAERNTPTYPKGVKARDFHSERNYTLGGCRLPRQRAARL